MRHILNSFIFTIHSTIRFDVQLFLIEPFLQNDKKKYKMASTLVSSTYPKSMQVSGLQQKSDAGLQIVKPYSYMGMTGKCLYNTLKMKDSLKILY